VALTFRRDKILYDRPKGLMRFTAFEGSERVECAISVWALAALEDEALEGGAAMAATYRRNRGIIQEAAERKHRKGQFESDGSVIVRVPDVAPQAWQLRVPARR
jgi:hypothetical protein